MHCKVISKKKLTSKELTSIIGLMDVFRKPKGKKSITKSQVKEVMAHPANTVIAAYEGDTMVGIAVLVKASLFTARLGIIDEVVVSDAHRKKGIASRMLREAVRIAKKQKLDLLKVDTNADNKAANRLYKKERFVARNGVVYKRFL